MSRLVLLLVLIVGYLYWSGFFTPKPPPEPEVISWVTPRDIRTTNGQLYENATIRGVMPDGGLVINHRGNTIKIAGNLVPADTMKEVERAKPTPSPNATPRKRQATSLDRPVRDK